MGNCLNAAEERQWRRGSETVMPMPEEEEEEVKAEVEAGLKVKVVLTRAELEWLMAQLNSGDRRLEDVLHQMGAARAKRPPRCGDGWRPRLECIHECHEATYPASNSTPSHEPRDTSRAPPPNLDRFSPRGFLLGSSIGV